jgi:hypothetical protein
MLKTNKVGPIERPAINETRSRTYGTLATTIGNASEL